MVLRQAGMWTAAGAVMGAVGAFFAVRLFEHLLFHVSGTDEIDRLKERQIGDFRQWQDKRLYQRAFSQLVRALTISASVESARQS